MLTRRAFLRRALQGSSLVALGSVVPRFVASAAQGSKVGDDTVLVVLEMAGGNDGLNTVVPYADDLYHKARPTLRRTAEQVIRVDDRVGLNESLYGLKPLLDDGRLAIVQGVGYPNPNRSHFESMDVWQSADPTRRLTNGWLGRALGSLKVRDGHIPAFHIDDGQLPLALTGSASGVPTLNTSKPFGLDLGGEFYGHDPDRNGLSLPPVVEESSVDAGVVAVDVATVADPASEAVTAPTPGGPAGSSSRKDLIRGLTEFDGAGSEMLQFVQRTSLNAYSTIDVLKEIMSTDFQLPDAEYRFQGGTWGQDRRGLLYELTLVARMIRAGFGTRVFYVSMDGYDTHSGQLADHNGLLETLGTAVGHFFDELRESGDAERVVLMTYSEFGRRVEENASRGTDHGSGSSLFLAGPAVRGGLVGDHPSLAPDKLDAGDLQWHTDFRRVYATLLDVWLGCDSRRVLDGEFEHVPLFETA